MKTKTENVEVCAKWFHGILIKDNSLKLLFMVIYHNSRIKYQIIQMFLQQQILDEKKSKVLNRIIFMLLSDRYALCLTESSSQILELHCLQ